ncbi:MAG TPA: SLAC1 anion channel family protein [Noviherbaspirillum sp.]
MSSSIQGASLTAQSASSLAHFPVPLFSSVMGMAGLAIAWHKAHAVLGAPAFIGDAIRLLATLLFILLAAVYVLKWLRHPDAALAEANHPVRINFLSTISIGILLLATAWLDTAPMAAALLWAVGAIAHLVLTVRTINSWIHHSHYDIKHVNPAWFIPVVGNIIVPIAGVRIASPEISWFFFSIGIVFWIVLLSIVMNRLFFQEQLPVRLMPTLFILLAPPSVGFLAWTALSGGIDAFGRVLFYTAVFLALLLASSAFRFLRQPFFISAWAYSFPLAALTVATFVMAEHAGGTVLAAVAVALLTILTMVITLLAARTAIAVQRRQICVPE